MDTRTRLSRPYGIAAVAFGVFGVLLYVVGDVAQINYLSTLLMLGGIASVLIGAVLCVAALIIFLVGYLRRD